MFMFVFTSIISIRIMMLLTATLALHAIIIKNAFKNKSLLKISIKMLILDLLSGIVSYSLIVFLLLIGVIDAIYSFVPGIYLLKALITLAVVELIEQIIRTIIHYLLNIHIKKGKTYNSFKLKYYFKNTIKHYGIGLAYNFVIFAVGSIVALVFGTFHTVYNIVLSVAIILKDRYCTPERVLI